MRISDWSSDVCSSDLRGLDQGEQQFVGQLRQGEAHPVAEHGALARIERQVRELEDCLRAKGPCLRAVHCLPRTSARRCCRASLLQPCEKLGGLFCQPSCRPTGRLAKIGRESCREKRCTDV